MTWSARCCAGLLVLWLGCGSPSAEPAASCSESLEQALFNATTVESYLALTEGQQRAVVAILDEADASSICSGAFIADTWVLTAAHCDELVDAKVVVPAGTRMPSFTAPVVRRELYGRADVALFQVDFSMVDFGEEHAAPEAKSGGSLVAAALHISPLVVPSRALSRLVPGVAVELAGYGTTETGDAGRLRFLVEQVVAATPALITVAGFGRSGACGGDSGGPLLMCDEPGSVLVAGVLWGGSQTCLYEDDYLRTDASAIQQSIRSIVNVEDAGMPEQDCGGVTAEGRCLYGTALWCERGSLSMESCSNGQVCGWDPSAAAFRCVSPDSPCSGVDTIGECRDGKAVRCVRGRTQTVPCDACGACRIDAASGAPYCGTDAD